MACSGNRPTLPTTSRSNKNVEVRIPVRKELRLTVVKTAELNVSAEMVPKNLTNLQLQQGGFSGGRSIVVGSGKLLLVLASTVILVSESHGMIRASSNLPNPITIDAPSPKRNTPLTYHISLCVTFSPPLP
jgi:hypothetical protein